MKNCFCFCYLHIYLYWERIEGSGGGRREQLLTPAVQQNHDEQEEQKQGDRCQDSDCDLQHDIAIVRLRHYEIYINFIIFSIYMSEIYLDVQLYLMSSLTLD